MRTLTTIKAALLCAFLATPAQADFGKYVHTCYLDASGGISTHKSELVNSNDTGTLTSIETGVWAGNKRNLGVALRLETASIAFGLNSATKSFTHQDVMFRYRLGFMPLYFGAGVSNSSWQASRSNDDDPDTSLTGTDVNPFLDMTTKGYLLNVGAFIPVGKATTFFVDGIQVTPSSVQASVVEQSDGTFTAADSSLGVSGRTDINIGATSTIVKRWLDFIVGYKMTSYQMTVKDETSSEQDTVTYLGLRTGWTF